MAEELITVLKDKIEDYERYYKECEEIFQEVLDKINEQKEDK